MVKPFSLFVRMPAFSGQVNLQGRQREPSPATIHSGTVPESSDLQTMRNYGGAVRAPAGPLKDETVVLVAERARQGFT